MKKIILILAVTTLSIRCIGQLYDPTFNGSGVWNQQIGNSYNRLDGFSLQPDGQILFCGETQSNSNDTTNFMVGRLNTNGSLDNTFDGDGFLERKFSIDKFNGANDVKYINGKIYAAGYLLSLTSSDHMLIKLNVNGTLDQTFDSDGILTVAPEALPNGLNSIHKTSANEIVAIGASTNSGPGIHLSGFKVDQNAGFINSYGGNANGILNNSSITSALTQVSYIQTDDKILILENSILLRIDNNGILDNSFGINGILNLNFTSPEEALGLTVQKDGKIILCGKNANNDFSVNRYNSDGSTDISFGVSGKVVVPFNGTTAVAKAVIVDTTSLTGKIFVAGYSYYNLSGQVYYALARISPTDGTIEAYAEFQPNGLKSTPEKILLQTDGKILIAGNSTGYSIADVIITRINPNFTTVIAGVEEATQLSGGLNLFPNPASQNINVHSVYAIQQIRVIDVLGNEVLTLQSSGNTQVDISALPKGLYNFVITTDRGIGSKKVSIQ